MSALRSHIPPAFGDSARRWRRPSPGSPAFGRASTTALALCAWLTGTAITGCGASALELGRKAYLEGRLADAEQQLKSVGQDDDSEYAEAQILLESLAADRREVAPGLLLQAQDAHTRADRGRAAYADALAFYRAAEQAFDQDSPEQQQAAEAIARIEKHTSGLRNEFDKTVEDLSQHLDECDPGTRIVAIQRLAILREQLGLRFSLTGAALAGSRACFLAERYADAAALSELADSVRRDEHLDASAAVRAALARAWKPTETTVASDQTRDTEPKPAPHRKGPMGRRKPAPPVVQPATATPERASQLLSAAERLFAAGSRHEALRTLVAAMPTIRDSAEAVAQVSAQLDRWRDARDELIREYLANGEESLRAENSEAAYDWYRRILELDPTHNAALDRLRKIETLRELRNGAR